MCVCVREREREHRYFFDEYRVFVYDAWMKVGMELNLMVVHNNWKLWQKS